MPTKTTEIDGPTLIASGEQSVTVCFLKSGVGSFFVNELTTLPDATAEGAYLGAAPESMTLDADQHLIVTGSGTLVVIARNPVV